MEQKAIDLLKGKNLVFIATLMKDGSPQLSPVWADYEDGSVMINTAEGRIKHKNVLNDTRVAVSVVANENPLDMITIRGKVVEILPDYDYAHINKLTKKYMGVENYPFRREGEKRIVFKIKPDKVFVLPELKMNHD
ncbi:MAG: PPOX class F420-dependent oxidoreductase [Thaumarchaeota archaeon]|nr:PPOX class F420-dependent oxidoreductase [Nitrososphaerota archaeon]